jgi:hypothetical protein
MRRLVFWLAGLALVAFVARRARRRESPPWPEDAAPDAAADDPAGELRRTLEAARGKGEAASAEPSLAERRERVHAKAQEAIDLMREAGETGP